MGTLAMSRLIILIW